MLFCGDDDDNDLMMMRGNGVFAFAFPPYAYSKRHKVLPSNSAPLTCR